MLYGNYQHRDRRIDYAFHLIEDQIHQTKNWLKLSREVSSFTYDITEESLRSMIGVAASTCSVSINEAQYYFEEIINNTEFMQKVSAANRTCKFSGELDEVVRPGRKLLLYALMRIKKPKNVIEAGPYRGYGSVFLIEALRKNAEEGAYGALFCVDILDTFNGDIVDACGYQSFREVCIGDAVEFIEKFNNEIDVFISETHYAGGYEKQLRAINGKLSKNSVIYMTSFDDALYNYSKYNNRNYLSFYTKSKDHVYPGQFSCISY